MKKLINNSEQVVEKMINGMVVAHSRNIKKLNEENIIVRYGTIENEKVSLASGSGSGHEPAHVGLCGRIHDLLRNGRMLNYTVKT